MASLKIIGADSGIYILSPAIELYTFLLIGLNQSLANEISTFVTTYTRIDPQMCLALVLSQHPLSLLLLSCSSLLHIRRAN